MMNMYTPDLVVAVTPNPQLECGTPPSSVFVVLTDALLVLVFVVVVAALSLGLPRASVEP